MNVIAAHPGPRFRVLGTRGTWTKHGLDVQEAALREGADPRDPGFGRDPSSRWGVLDTGEVSHRVPTEPGRYTTFYEGLLHAIRDGGPPPVDPSDAVAGLEIIEAARRRSGRT
jgi:scyllo-inositol 2-dehydrogenase (NADP+)